MVLSESGSFCSSTNTLIHLGVVMFKSKKSESRGRISIKKGVCLMRNFRVLTSVRNFAENYIMTVDLAEYSFAN